MNDPMRAYRYDDGRWIIEQCSPAGWDLTWYATPLSDGGWRIDSHNMGRHRQIKVDGGLGRSILSRYAVPPPSRRGTADARRGVEV